MISKAKSSGVFFIGMALFFASNVNANQYELAIDGIQSSVPNQPVSFGMVFGDEKVAFDEAFSGTIWIDGQEYPLPVQVDRKASHCSESSFEFKSKTECSIGNRYLRHGIFSAVLPASIPQGERATVFLNSGGVEAGGSSITFPGDLDVLTELTMDGDIWEADLSNSVTSSVNGELPAAGTSSAAVAEWITGPIAREWIVRVPFVRRSNPSEMHDHLVARYHVRHYNGSNTRIDTIVENNWSFVPNVGSYEYEARIYIDNALRYEDTALTHFPHARWKVQLWADNYPEIQVIHDPNQIIESRAVPNYTRDLIGNISAATRADYDSDWSLTSPTVTGGVLTYNDKRRFCFRDENSGFFGTCGDPDIFELTINFTGPMGIGRGVERYMKATGGRGDIAPLPKWAAVALLDQRYSAYKQTLAVADGAGSWSVHLRDENTDQVLSLIDHPALDFQTTVSKSNLVETCDRSAACAKPYVSDTSHQPSMTYYPYLITGDYFYLEELQFWTTYNAASKSPLYRARDKGLLEAVSQTRAMGWSLRTLGQAAFITPDNNSLKEFYLHMLKSNIDDYTQIYLSDPAQSNTYGMVHPGASTFPIVSPWMQDYLGWASGYVANMGYDSMIPFARWKGKFVTQRMGFDNSNYCWVYGANYHLWVGSNTSKRPESGAAQTVTVRNRLGTGQVKLQDHFLSIDDVWIHSNTATNGGYDMVGGGVINTTQVCGSAEMGAEIGLAAGQMKYEGATGLVAQMQPAMAVAVDMQTNEAADAWNRLQSRTSPPRFDSSPQWSIEPIAVSISGGGALPTNGYTPIDNSGEQVDVTVGQCVAHSTSN